ncbi:MAG: DUF1402 family protein, partial [bacterium]|nr:DUF1402 family protein [bacterium]
NTRGKNLAFVSDSLKVFSLQDALQKAEINAFGSLFIVHGTHGKYLRSAANVSEKDNLDSLSVSIRDILEFMDRIENAESTDPLTNYTKKYFASLADENGPFLTPVGSPKVLIAKVKEKIIYNAPIIRQVAKEFNIDRYLLGAIIIDEVARLAPFEDIVDLVLLEVLGRNVSVGIAQVKLETANNLIKKKLYNPNPEDKKIPFSGTLDYENRKYLYKYVVEPKHNIRFAAAYIRDSITVWARKLDLSNHPEIVATFYSKGYDLKNDPEPSKRGKQIAEEFYVLAKKWLD